MNLGIASFGTVAEKTVYEKFARSHTPDIVLLFFYRGNDITDNNCDQSRGPGGTILKPCGEIYDGIVTFPTNFYSVSGNHALRSFARENCFLCGLVRNFIVSLKAKEVAGPLSRETVALYLPQGTAGQSIEDSWAITEEALRRLKSEVEADGARLIVVSLPDVVSVSLNSKEELIREYGATSLPDDFDPLEPDRRLAVLTSKLSIESISLTDAFRDYRDRYSLPYPYFSYSCDGHWNPVGHALAATVIADYLTGASTTPASPEDILGDPGYRAVYEGGIYRP